MQYLLYPALLGNAYIFTYSYIFIRALEEEKKLINKMHAWAFIRKQEEYTLLLSAQTVLFYLELRKENLQRVFN